MLTFHQFALLEDLSDVYLKPVEVGEHSRAHKWEMHHPTYGHLADVHLSPTEGFRFTKDGNGTLMTMRHADSALMSIRSLHNKQVPQHDIVQQNTAKGPQYNLGARGTRQLLRKIAQEYPHLKTVTGPRVTGLRGALKGNGSEKSAEVHLDRLRGAIAAHR